MPTHSSLSDVPVPWLIADQLPYALCLAIGLPKPFPPPLPPLRCLCKWNTYATVTNSCNCAYCQFFEVP